MAGDRHARFGALRAVASAPTDSGPRTTVESTDTSRVINPRAAARDLADGGAEIRMPAVAAAARVSEATACRYLPTWSSRHRAVQGQTVIVSMNSSFFMST